MTQMTTKEAVEAQMRVGAKDTRNMVDILREALVGADRVVIETRNALGEMDAHYLPAPALLEAFNTHSVEPDQ